MYSIYQMPIVDQQIEELTRDKSQSKRLKAVRKALRLLCENPRHPSLNTHQFHSRVCPHGDKVWEAYAENNTPGAYRIFFCYGLPSTNTLWILSVEPHP